MVKFNQLQHKWKFSKFYTATEGNCISMNAEGLLVNVKEGEDKWLANRKWDSGNINISLLCYVFFLLIPAYNIIYVLF